MSRAEKTARLSILSNTLLIAMKFAVGFFSGSVSIISEAVHSLMDLLAAIMAYFSIRASARPPDEGHPYGHDKVENISGVIEAILIVAAVVFIVVESVDKLIERSPVQNLELGVLVMLVSGIVNIVVSRILYKVSREVDSVALEADALHLKTDVYSSLGVATGLLLIVVLKRILHSEWFNILDPIIAMVIALFILYEAWLMLKKAFMPLIDATLPAEEIRLIRDEVESHQGCSIHGIRTRKAGKTRHIDFHLVVPASTTVLESHELCDTIETDLERKLKNTDVLIHLEPGLGTGSSSHVEVCKDTLIEKIKAIASQVTDQDLGVHHLHIHVSDTKTDLTFHINVDSSMPVKEAHDLASRIESLVGSELGYETTIHIEPVDRA